MKTLRITTALLAFGTAFSATAGDYYVAKGNSAASDDNPSTHNDTSDNTKWLGDGADSGGQ